MKLKRSAVPSRLNRGDTSMFATLISREMRSELTRNPGVTFQLVHDDGSPQTFPKKAVLAAQSSCPHPFRIQSRATTGGRFHLWVSMDPAYWERVSKQRKRERKPKGAES